MFPKADCYQLYLQHFAAANALEIKYGSDIPHGAIRREGEGGRYRLTDSDGAVFSCKYLIVATGLGQEVKLPAQMHGSEHVKYYSEFDTDPTRYRNKTVLIMGNGNSALETSEGMVGYTATTFVIGQNSERYSWESHNRGHMRAINSNTLDTYQLKSLNVITEHDFGTGQVIWKEEGGHGRFYMIQDEGRGVARLVTRARESGADPVLPDEAPQSSMPSVLPPRGEALLKKKLARHFQSKQLSSASMEVRALGGGEGDHYFA